MLVEGVYQLKNIFLALISVFIFSSVSYASVFMDLNGAYVMTGDAETQYGGGGAFGFSIAPDLSLLAKGTYSTVTKNLGDPDEMEYKHWTSLFGFEYTPIIPFLERYRLSWKSMFLAGLSSTEVSDTLNNEDYSDTGFAMAIMTGIKYDATQNISPFINIGYHYSMYWKDMEDASINGFQAEIGVRFYFTGSRSYSDRY